MKTSTKLFFTALLGCVIAACASGCVNVPATKITIPKYGTIESPKQVEVEDLSIVTPDGTNVRIGKLRSVNDATIISSQGQVNLEMLKEAGALVDKGAALGAKGVTP